MSVEIRDLGFSYRAVSVLNGLDADAKPGRITALLGPNAAGKSTLLRCIVGVLRPDTGSVRIRGLEAASMSAARRARLIAYVAQRPIVSAAFTVRQVVELGRYALPPDAKRIDEAIAAMDLAAVVHRPYPQLSAGQQQRVSLARAMAQAADDGCLVLDEPTAAMDWRHVMRTMQVLRGLAQRGVTIVLAMHDLTLAAAVADDVWLLHDGRLAASGPADEAFDPELLRKVFGVRFDWFAAGEGRPRRLLPELPVDVAAMMDRR